MIKNFQPRLYQQTILGTAANKNTLVVLPTGLGKTALAFLLAAQRLSNYPNSKILMLTPTKPLCEQHVETFKQHLDIDENKVVLFTGSVKPVKRAEMWKEATVIISTPQGLENDVINKRVLLDEVSLLVFDECVSKSSLIELANGEKIKIEDIENKIKNQEIFLETLNENTGNLEPRKIEKFHKIKSKKDILSIFAGKEKIKVTSDHLFYIRVKGECKWTPAKDIKKDMEVSFGNIKKEIVKKKVIIQEEDILKQYSKEQGLFYDQYQKVNFIRKEKGYGARKTSQITGINEGTIRNWINNPFRQPVPFRLITSLKKNGLLPLYSDNFYLPILARIMGHMYGDGWCYNDKNNNLHFGFSGRVEDLKVIQQELGLLDVKCSMIHSRKTSSRIKTELKEILYVDGTSNSFVVTDKKLTKLFAALNVPIGNKTTNIPFIPKWIMEGSLKIKKEFLSSLMGSESYSPTLKSNSKTCNPVRLSFNIIKELENKGEEYAFQLKKLFLDLNVLISISKRKGNIRNDGHITLKFLLTISNSNENMICFLEKINYTYAISKRVQANKILGFLILKKEMLENRICLYDKAKSLQKQGYGSHKIAKMLKESRGTIENWIYFNKKPSVIPILVKGYKNNNKIFSNIQSVRWKKVTKITKSNKEEFVYDLTIQENHNYFANGFLVHNCHHATGDYAYVWVADQYHKLSKHERILALTASPASDLDKIKEVCHNLKIEKVEVRTEKDPDVKPYIQKVKQNWVEVKFPEEFKEVQKYLKDCRKSKLIEAQNYGYCNNLDMMKGEMLGLQRDFQRQISQGERSFEMLRSVSLVAEALKVEHAIELLESQGIVQAQTYLKKIQTESLTSKVKAVKNLVQDINFKSAAYLAEELIEKKIEHPKVGKLKEIVKEVVGNNNDAKIIIFTQFRDSAQEIVKSLNQEKISNHIFVGQAKKNGLGFSQKQQKEILDNFRSGKFNILIATSVAEEGLDIPKVDKVLFYEPVPSAIRSIQRRGRTGRLEEGEVTFLVTQGTRDVGYRWSSHHKEKRMYRNLEKIKKEFSLMKQEPVTLKKFIDDDKVIAIVADHREKDNKTVKELIELGVSVRTAQLVSADYLVSDKVGIELKKVPDFVNSIVDGRLLGQVKDLRNNFEKAILIIEGEEDIYSVRKVHANAIRGMLASIVLDFSVPVLYTKNPKDTAALLAVMAKREQESSGELSYHERKPHTPSEQQEFVVSAFPGIGTLMARNLLNYFGSIKAVVNSSKEELVALEGVGEKTAIRLLELFDEKYVKD